MRQLLTVAILSLVTLANATATDDDEHKYLKAFPAAEDGMSRYVIELPHKERGEEDNFKVEITVGKEVLTDGVNLYHLEKVRRDALDDDLLQQPNPDSGLCSRGWRSPLSNLVGTQENEKGGAQLSVLKWPGRSIRKSLLTAERLCLAGLGETSLQSTSPRPT